MKPLKLIRTGVLAASLMALTGVGASSAGAATSDALLFGVVPQQSATRLAQIWVPLLKRLSEDTGLNIKFTTTKDIPTFEKCVASGAYELAYMNPYHYVLFSQSPGYVAFAKQTEKKLRGLIVVRKDSAAHNLRDLADAKFAFPSPGAFGASVLPRAEMRKNRIVHHPNYVRSHDSVYRSVAAGLFPAGGGVGRTFGNIDPKIRDQLRVVYRTEKYTPHAFAHGPQLTPATAEKVRAAMVAINESAPQLLEPLGFKGFETARDSDWSDVRALNLTEKETEILREGETVCRSD